MKKAGDRRGIKQRYEVRCNLQLVRILPTSDEPEVLRGVLFIWHRSALRAARKYWGEMRSMLGGHR